MRDVVKSALPLRQKDNLSTPQNVTLNFMGTFHKDIVSNRKRHARPHS